MFRRIVQALLALVALVLLAGAATFLFVCWQINRTGTHDEAQRADAIVVLGARVELNGQPGPDLRVRTLHAVDLFQRGLAPYLICTGGYRNDRLSAASVARDLALSQGVPAKKILLADGSSTTSEDAASVAQLMADRGWRTAILVSHPLHLERTRLLFEDQGISSYPSPTSTNLEAIPWETRLWLTTREAFGIAGAYLEEIGVPYDWTIPLSRWVYGLPEPPGAN